MLSNDSVKYIISRVLDNAKDAFEEADENKDDDFYKGKKLAYYEILDTIKNELDVREEDLKDFGLDVDLERIFEKF